MHAAIAQAVTTVAPHVAHAVAAHIAHLVAFIPGTVIPPPIG